MKTLIPIDILLEDHVKYHTKFQMDNFITSQSGLTPYGMYRQALREIKKRKQGLDRHALQRRGIVERIRLAGDPKTELEAIKLERRTLDLADLDESIFHTRRELLRFQEQASTIRPDLGDLTEAHKEELERDMFIRQLRLKAAIERVAQGKVSQSTIENIACLQEQDAREVVLGIKGAVTALLGIGILDTHASPRMNGQAVSDPKSRLSDADHD